MSYPYLQKGDTIPAVGVLQRLLNDRTGAYLEVDGIFGNKTKQAVEKFQKIRNLKKDGIVGEKTWPLLTASTNNLKVLDCIDVFDKSLYESEYKDILRVGGDPVIIGGMSNGISQAIHLICSVAKTNSIFLLRFHGHGYGGLASISSGDSSFEGEHYSDIHIGNYNKIRNVIIRLKPIFGPYGCIQFMHCKTASGKSGRTLLSKIANDLGVPVSAAIFDQYGGGIATFRFEGRTATRIPGNTGLKHWCKKLPQFTKMSVNIEARHLKNYYPNH